MHALAWFRDNVIGNAIADIFCGIPAYAIAIWRFEKRHKRHMQQIHNQITQTMKANDK